MNIAAYCRVSTMKDAQLDSLENQKTFFREYAKNNNHTLIKLYADEGISGKALKNREQFIQMIEESASGDFDMIVVKDISRFARNTVDFLQSIRKLKSQGVEILFLSNNQTVLGNSEFIITVFSALAQEESANLSKRVKFGKSINAQKGRVPNTTYGYDWIDNYNLKINDAEAETVKKIFDMYVGQGLGTRQIALKLNENKICTKKGACWSPKTIRRMLQNTIYNGVLINHKMEVADFIEGKIKPLPKSEWLTHQKSEYKIIDDEAFNKAEEILNNRKEQYKSKTSDFIGRYSGKHLLSTLIKCEHCGYSFCRKTYKYKNSFIKWKCTGFNQFTSFFCSNNATIDECELIQKIRDFFICSLQNQDKFISCLIKDYKTQYNSTKSPQADKNNINQIKNKIDKIENSKDKFKMMCVNDIISMEELKIKIAELDLQKKELEIKMMNTSLSEPTEEEIQERIKKYFGNIDNFLRLENWSNSDIRKLINKIVVNKNREVHIYLNT